MNYHFGVSGMLVWIIHILFGIYFGYLGYTLVNSNEKLRLHGMILGAVGTLMIAYHSHLMVNHMLENNK